MRKNSRQMSLFDICNDMSEAVETKKSELIDLLEKDLCFHTYRAVTWRGKAQKTAKPTPVIYRLISEVCFFSTISHTMALLNI